MTVTSIVPVSVANISASQMSSNEIASTQIAGAAPNAIFDTLLDHLQNVNTQLVNTDKAVQQLASGETDNLHQVMISMEQTRLAFDLVLQVRNKVMDAYQEIMRMQV